MKMERWEWDETIGPRPEGYDNWPIEKQAEAFMEKKKELQFIIGPVYESYSRWMIDGDGNEEDWIRFRKRMYEEQKKTEISYRSFLAEQIESAHDRIDKLAFGRSRTIVNILYILIGFAIGFYFV